MVTICKNCCNEFSGNFCNNCGQDADTHKLNFHYMWHDIQHGLLHIDKGILFSCKELFTRPGHSIREFVEGKRVKHFKPLSLLIVLATLYGVMYHYFHISAVPELDQGQIGVNKVFLEKLNDWLGSHLVLVNLLSIPIYTLGSYFTFKKQGYNLIEHFVLNAYYIGQRLFLIILTFPITLYLNKAHHLIIFSRIQLVINFILMVWVYAQFFNKSDFFRTLFNALLTYLAFWLVFGLVVVAAVQELS